MKKFLAPPGPRVMTQLANVFEHDHEPAGEAIRAVLRPGERLLAHSHLVRSPGLEEAPPGSFAMLNGLNPFAGFSETSRTEGVGSALLGAALGGHEKYSPASLHSKNEELRKYGQTFCGVKDSQAGRLIAGVAEHADVSVGGRPAWVALTDRRLVVFADPERGPTQVIDVNRPILEMVASLVKGIRQVVYREPRPAKRRGYSGAPLFPIFECPPHAVVATPAPPAFALPRVGLSFADQSWLIISFGVGEPAARLAAALRPGAPPISPNLS